MVEGLTSSATDQGSVAGIRDPSLTDSPEIEDQSSAPSAVDTFDLARPAAEQTSRRNESW